MAACGYVVANSRTWRISPPCIGRISSAGKVKSDWFSIGSYEFHFKDSATSMAMHYGSDIAFF